MGEKRTGLTDPHVEDLRISNLQENLEVLLRLNREAPFHRLKVRMLFAFNGNFNETIFIVSFSNFGSLRYLH